MPWRLQAGFRPLTPAAVTCAVAALLTACGSSPVGDSDAEVTVVATTTQVADLVRNVDGDRVEVHQLLTPGADPHEYEPRPSDAQAVAEAGAVFQSGGDLDAWLGDVIENAGGDAEVVTLLDAVEAAPENGEAAAEPTQTAALDDPHWCSPASPAQTQRVPGRGA